MHDLIVIGGGPSGLAAAIYAARYKLDTLVLSAKPGGAITEAHDVQNFPGFKEISGMELMDRIKEQAEFQGVEIKNEEALEVISKDDHFLINDKYEAKAVILALGTKRRTLNIPGETEYAGKGVSYCATCDAAFFKDKVVGVVGGSNSAAMAAQLLSDHSKKVYIIYRKERMRAEPARVEDLESKDNVEFIYNNNVTKVYGEKLVKGVELEKEHNGSEKLELDGLFIEIGSVPSTSLAKSAGVELNENEMIIVDSGQRTNVKGVYASGDITTNSDNFWQLITAMSEGAVAAHSVYLDIKDKKI